MFHLKCQQGCIKEGLTKKVLLPRNICKLKADLLQRVKKVTLRITPRSNCQWKITLNQHTPLDVFGFQQVLLF